MEIPDISTSSTFEELNREVRKRVHAGRDDVFKKIAKKIGGLSDKEVQTWFEIQVKEGRIAMLPTGLWNWTK